MSAVCYRKCYYHQHSPSLGHNTVLCNYLANRSAPQNYQVFRLIVLFLCKKNTKSFRSTFFLFNNQVQTKIYLSSFPNWKWQFPLAVGPTPVLYCAAQDFHKSNNIIINKFYKIVNVIPMTMKYFFSWYHTLIIITQIGGLVSNISLSISSESKPSVCTLSSNETIIWIKYLLSHKSFVILNYPDSTSRRMIPLNPGPMPSTRIPPPPPP